MESIKNDYVNYNKSDRKKLHFSLELNNEKNHLIFDDKKIILNDNKEIINYDDIKKIKLSLCSRIYNPTVVSSNLLEIMIKRWTKGIVGTTNKGVHIIYSADFDVFTNNKTYYFESYSLNNILQIIELLSVKNIKIDDPIGIYSILIKNKDQNDLQKYLDLNFQFLAKKYNLDNPRGVLLNRE